MGFHGVHRGVRIRCIHDHNLSFESFHIYKQLDNSLSPVMFNFTIFMLPVVHSHGL